MFWSAGDSSPSVIRTLYVVQSRLLSIYVRKTRSARGSADDEAMLWVDRWRRLTDHWKVFKRDDEKKGRW